MGAAREKGPVARVAALLCAAGEDPQLFLDALAGLWGAPGLVGAPIQFGFTDFYENEMGPDLVRRFVLFRDPAPADGLRDWKIEANALEGRFASGGRRRLNADPGYLDPGAVVVASVKDAASRVYLGKGIYAQPMLRFEAGSFRAWPWTYPDYASPEAIRLFNAARAACRDMFRQPVRGR